MARIILALVVTFSFAFLLACGDSSSGSGGSNFGPGKCAKDPFSPACIECGQKAAACLADGGPCDSESRAAEECYDACDADDDACNDDCDEYSLAVFACMQSKCKDAICP